MRWAGVTRPQDLPDRLLDRLDGPRSALTQAHAMLDRPCPSSRWQPMSLIRYVTRIHFADRAMEDALPEELRMRGLVSPLIYVDPDAGAALPRLLDCLHPKARPRIVHVEAGQNTCAPVPDPQDAPDLVIGLGGGAAIDLARQTGRPTLPDDLPRMAIPTLPGCLGLGPLPRPTAHSKGRAALPGTAQSSVPCVVFCDPWLLQYADPQRLAMAGMDALVQCLEALLSMAWNPPADGMAADGLRRAARWLEHLVSDPSHAEARREVMAAALNGALAAQKGLGALHALSHAAQGLGLAAPPHGSLHTALLRPVLAFNAPAVPDRIELAAQALRLTNSADLAAHLSDLGERLGLSQGLVGLGLTRPGIRRMAEIAADNPANRTNPRLATARDYRALIEAAL